MDETGIVVEILDDNAKVSMVRTEACAKCGACSPGMRNEEMIIVAKNTCGAEKGNEVEIKLNEGAFLSAVLIMYGIPLIMLLIGFFVGDFILANIGVANRDIPCFIIGICTLLISYFIISKNERSFKAKKYEPIVTRIIE